MYQASTGDPKHGSEPGAPALMNASANDIEHGRTGDDQQRESAHKEETECR
jgi:hypothetical protein